MRRTLLALGVTLAAACSEPVEPTVDPSEAAATAAADASARWATDARRALDDDFESVYARLVGGLVDPQPLRNVLLSDDDPGPLERRRFLAHLYDERDFAPALLDSGTFGPRAQAALAALEAVGEHGLDPARYLEPELYAAIEALRELSAARAALPGIAATRAERRALADAVDTLDGPTDDTARTVLERALAGSADGSGAPVVAEALADLATAHELDVALRRATVGASALVDALLVDALLAYAFDQRLFNTTAVDEDLTEPERHELIAERTRETFRAIAGAGDAAALQAVIDALPPQHPQYAGLLRERARYAAIVEAGGWREVPSRNLSRGSRGDTVTALARRLAIEGYYPAFDEAEPPRDFDETMEQAVRDYQSTHQMEVTGEPDRGFWASLNIPADQRLAQIDLTLQRWRENRIGDDPYYVHINIPDFHTEVWRNGQREMRFRIVVGNTQQVCDPRTGRTTYANATPIQSAEMTYVVLNPTWNVPSRIVEEELLPALLEDPTYFETMGFERYTTPGGIEIVRQLPGPENPLGRVKFMFPNPHNTYLHDTSRPQYFRFPVRAFSHGCMRVQDPLDFLEYLLRQDGQWDDDRIERIFESKEETTIVLREPIPVHAEYYVVRVDDDGRANFLADIYRLDRDRLDPPDPDRGRCEPEAAPGRLILGEGDVVMVRDADGNEYTTEQWDYIQSGGTLRQLPDGTFEAPPASGSGQGALPGIDTDEDEMPADDDTVIVPDVAGDDFGP